MRRQLLKIGRLGFQKGFANVFIHFLETKSISRLVIVFVDGHTSHLSLNLSNLCRRIKGTILICLPPNITHLLQPFVAIFPYWNRQVASCCLITKEEVYRRKNFSGFEFNFGTTRFFQSDCV